MEKEIERFLNAVREAYFEMFLNIDNEQEFEEARVRCQEQLSLYSSWMNENCIAFNEDDYD